jgi:hypothetical protein
MRPTSFLCRKDAHTFYHCIVFFGKIKEIFSARGDFFAQTAELFDRNCQEINQGKECVGPEVPDGL